MSDRVSQRLKEKQKALDLLKTDVTQMQEQLKERRENAKRKRAREDICFWMDNAIFPFLEGVAGSFNEPLIDGIRRLIKEKKNPFRPRKNGWDRTRETDIALKTFLMTPQTKVLQVLAKPFIRQKLSWINKEAEWVRETILKEEYPDVYDAIMKTEGGEKWLDELITDLMKYLRRSMRR